MKWTIEYYSQNVQNLVNNMPLGVRAHYAKLATLLIEFGMDLRLPHSRAMGGGLFDLRPRGKEGIGRVFYCMLVGKRVMVLHGYIKKTQEAPLKELEIARRRMKEVKNERH